MPALATAFVEARLDTSGFGSDIKRGVNSPSAIAASESAGKTHGAKYKGGFASSMKGFAAPIAGAIAAVGAVQVFKGMYSEAIEAQKAGKLTAAVIKSTGGAANVTAAQVEKLANSISLKTGVDDEAIQSGENMLLTFRNVHNEVGRGNNIFDRATVAANDMAAAFGGDAVSNSKLLGKALNDPIKGMSALTRVGVTFTEKQKAAVTAMIASGDTLGAQKVILREVSKETAGAAASQATAGAKLQVAWQNLEEEAGKKLLPVISKIFTFLAEKAIPAIEATAHTVSTTIVPAISQFVSLVASKAMPVISAIVGYIRKNWPEISATVKQVFKAAWAAVSAALIDIKAVIVLVTKVITAIWHKWGKDISAFLLQQLKLVIDIVKNALHVIRDVFNIFADILSGKWGKLWKDVKLLVQDALKLIGSIIKNALHLYAGLLAAAWALIKTGAAAGWRLIWGVITDKLNDIKRGVGNVISDIKKALGDAWSSIKQHASDAWGGIVSAIGRQIDKIKNAVMKPVGWVVNHVINPLISGFDKILSFVKVDPISTIKGFSSGGFTGNGGKYEPAGIVHRGEFVVQKDATQKIMSKSPNLLPSLNNGILPGYANGGKVGDRGADRKGTNATASSGTEHQPNSIAHWGHVWNWIKGHLGVPYLYGGNGPRYDCSSFTQHALAAGGFSVPRTAATQQGASRRISASQLIAGDLGFVGNPAHHVGMYIGDRKFAAEHHTGTVSSIVGWPGDGFESFGRIAPVGRYIAGLGQASADIGPGAGGGMPGFLSDPLGYLKGLIPNMNVPALAGPLGSVLKKIPGKLISSSAKWAAGWLKDKIKDLAGFAFGMGGPTNGTPTGNQVSGQAMAASMYGWTGGEWDSLVKLWNKESGWRTNASNPAGGDPRTSAYGIPQALPGRKMATAGSDWITNPITQIKWGLNYIRGRYTDPNHAWAHSQAYNWYDQGGWLKPGTNIVHNATGQKEAVLNPRQWQTMTRLVDKATGPHGMSGGGPVRIILDAGGGVTLTGHIDDRIYSQSAFDGTMGRMGQ